MAQLMSHRPGYEDSYAIFDPEIGALPRPQALAESAPDQVLPRGEVTAYSNWGVALAGQVVEDCRHAL
jgi:CubicO group peptidase (beta-lactamase class C family)